jgi:hypothetical protein
LEKVLCVGFGYNGLAAGGGGLDETDVAAARANFVDGSGHPEKVNDAWNDEEKQ